MSSSLPACGQELALPSRGQTADSGGDPGPSDGVTGGSGAPAEGSSKRLPLPDDAPYPAGGAETAPEQRHCVSCTGGAGRGGANGASEGNAQGNQSKASAGDGAGGAAGASETAPPPPPVLMFSEYVEDGGLKALEIYALTGGSLEGCELSTFFNGSTSPTRVALQGTLAIGEVQVLCTTKLRDAQPTLCDRTANLSFNGDDALALSCAGVMLDVIGDIGVDPGDSWGVGATADHTLQRRCEVTAGRAPTQPFDIEGEWIVYGRGTFSDLGSRRCDPPEALGLAGASG